MAPDVIDLVSSSPPGARHRPNPHHSIVNQSFSDLSSPPPRAATSRVGSTSLRNDSGSALPAEGSRLSRAEESFLSDDLEDLVNQDAPAATTHQRKRKRFDGSHAFAAHSSLAQSHASVSKSLPPLMMGKSHRRTETIEFTSSLEQPSPQQPASETPQNRQHGATSQADINGHLKTATIVDSDPFASSPQHGQAQPSLPQRAASMDPFLSSSPVHVSSYQNNTSSYRPEAKSRVEAISRNTYIPTSARQQPVSDVTTRTGTHESAAAAAIINLSDSDSLDEASSEDELPPITAIDPSERRARAPLRRSQSDITGSRVQSIHSRPTAKPAAARKTAAERMAEKVKKRQEREAAKALKAEEKHRAAAMAEVNKLRTDKKVSTPEMIVDLPSSLKSEIRVQVEEMLKGLGADHTTWQCPEHKVVKWRRKVTCKFNEDLGLWEPIASRVMDEDVGLLILTAEEFVPLAQDDKLAAYIGSIKEQFETLKLVYLLEGMTPWFRKNRNIRNRQFASEVRSGNAIVSSRDTSRNGRPQPQHVSEDVIEDALMALQVEHGALIHHTTVASETARWIVNFTQHVSTIPYKRQRDQATSIAGFCMDSGQVRTGDSISDTYVRMLQEIVRVTAPIAYGTASEFGSVTKLVQGLEAGGPERLDAVRKSANKDGAVSDRNIGQAVSRRLHKVFTGVDDTSTDV